MKKLSPTMERALGNISTKWQRGRDIGVSKITLDILVDCGLVDTKLDYHEAYKSKFRWYRLAQKEITE